MKKENRPLQAANIDHRGSDVTPPAYTVQASKRTPKKHRARTTCCAAGPVGGQRTISCAIATCRLAVIMPAS